MQKGGLNVGFTGAIALYRNYLAQVANVVLAEWYGIGLDEFFSFELPLSLGKGVFHLEFILSSRLLIGAVFWSTTATITK